MADESAHNEDGNSRMELKRKGTVEYFPREEERNSKRFKHQRLKPINAFCVPLLTDMYQITMAYAYWKNKKHEEPAVFDLFFRKNPFGGEYTVFAGLEEVLRFISDFKFTESQLKHLQEIMPTCDPEFFQWLGKQDCSKVKVFSLREGDVCFPRIPLIRVEGPVAIVQLLETPLLCLVNYPSLICTNAVRHRLAAGVDKYLLEFGLRRAQGPDGGMSASRYSYMGGFDGTSNVLAGQMFSIPSRGTHAHSFVSSFTGEEDMQRQKQARLKHKDTGEEGAFVEDCFKVREEMGYQYSNPNELLAFSGYALAYPESFLALVDTYETLESGVPNFLIVALTLHRYGYKALGIRLDSGDLAYLSRMARKQFKQAAEKYGIDYFAKFNIVASNDLNEATILSLNQQGHEIDTFGIGTHLVTCQAQPALGCVYKLVELNGIPRIKLSQDVSKVSIPGRKEAYRLFNKEGTPIFDMIVHVGGDKPETGKRILCRHPFDESKRAYVIPAKVMPLHQLVWDCGKITYDMPTLEETKQYCMEQVRILRSDHLRPLNPTPYKVSVNSTLYDFIHNLWQKEAPIREYS